MKRKCRAWNGSSMEHVEKLEYSPAYGGYVANGWILPEFVMEETGLRDRNWKEIFEGDVVILEMQRRPYKGAPDEEMIHTYHRTVAKFDSGAFWLSGDGVAVNSHFHYNAADREIIGNIHQNPELLK